MITKNQRSCRTYTHSHTLLQKRANGIFEYLVLYDCFQTKRVCIISKITNIYVEKDKVI